MVEADVMDMIRAGGVLYSAVRDQIQSGDLLALHHDFVPSWYGVKVDVVQRFTGPIAHVGLIDRITPTRLIVYEATIPKVRAVRISVAAEKGFFWLQMNRPITELEREACWADVGVKEYSTKGAIQAGLGMLPPAEEQNPRTWCSKCVPLWRRESDVYLGSSFVPTDVVLQAQNGYAAKLQYVRMF